MSGGIDYAGKPRPCVIIQNDDYEATTSLTVCLLTCDQTPVLITRPEITPSELNGLRMPSRLMVDKISTLPKTKFGRRIGRLSDEDITRLNRAMIVFLGLAAPSQTRG
jgi:mRNA interferase MazF